MKPSKQRVLLALKKTLVPIARLLLRVNIDCKEFMEVAKLAFVEVATDEYGIRDRKTNLSRVAIMTGLTRKEVGRIRINMAEGTEFVDLKPTVLGRVLLAWHEDPDFTDTSGKPKRLVDDGPGASFGELVRRNGGDVPIGATRKELLRMGLVKQHKNGRLRVLRKEAFASRDAEKLAKGFETLSIAGEGVEAQVRSKRQWPVTFTSGKRVRGADREGIKRISLREMRRASGRLEKLYEGYDLLHDTEELSAANCGVLQLYVELDEVALEANQTQS